MPQTSELVQPTSALGKWVIDFFEQLFCQPEDEIAASTLRDRTAEDFTARHNHDHFTRQSFIEAMIGFRIHGTTEILDVKEIQVWEAPDGSGGGSVSQLYRFTDIVKETGARTELLTLLIASVMVINGKKVLTDLTEVSNQLN
ncbi:hypothetical protein FCULG_00011876 [Fusarium culmorum]|uniref:SnoaL-like domain-containing protein n=1 Tax=Fusarium culmorum TaxID=5516 RepID=A0A2T4GS43_FUSCU|nr:hypothetical protein FCULG_00011876 [Fusarium culmorum]